MRANIPKIEMTTYHGVWGNRYYYVIEQQRGVVILLRNRVTNVHDLYRPIPKSALRRYIIKQRVTTVCPYPKTIVAFVCKKGCSDKLWSRRYAIEQKVTTVRPYPNIGSVQNLSWMYCSQSEQSSGSGQFHGSGGLGRYKTCRGCIFRVKRLENVCVT